MLANFAVRSSKRLLTVAALGSFSVAYSAETELLFSPAPVKSSLSRVVSDESGNLYLSWVEQKEGFAGLFYSTLDGKSWSEPQMISEGDDWFINWADFPALSVSGKSKVAHWLRMSAEGTYDYDIDARFYDAETDSWSNIITPHKDGVSAEHGFVAMLPVGEGNTLISWLDGRKTRTRCAPVYSTTAVKRSANGNWTPAFVIAARQVLPCPLPGPSLSTAIAPLQRSGTFMLRATPTESGLPRSQFTMTSGGLLAVL